MEEDMTSDEQYFLIVIPTDELGGAEQLLKALARNWIKENQKILIICLTSKGKGNGWTDLDNYIKYIPTSSVYKGLAKLSAYLNNNRFRLTISSQVYVNGALGVLRRVGILRTDRLILRESTSIFLRFTGFKKRAYQFFYKVGYRSADLVIYQTELMKSQLEENFTPAKYWNNAVLANPLDIDFVLSRADREVSMQLPPRFILGVGRLIPQKGFDLLIRAFDKLGDSHPDISLVIIGEGDERPRLESLIDEIGLDEKVLLPGFASNPFPIMKQAEVCVLSSRIEGFPNTLLQMMALNAKVVTTICAGGVQDIPFVEKSPIEDETLLADAIYRMLNSNGENEADRITYLAKRSIKGYLQEISNLLNSL